VAVRLNAPGLEEPLLRRLRVRTMVGGLLDDPELLAAAAADVGIEPARLEEWCARDDVEAALQADVEAARSPPAAARALEDQLGTTATRAALSRAAQPLAAGADFYWRL